MPTSLGEAVLELRGDHSKLDQDVADSGQRVEGLLGGLADVGGALVTGALALGAAAITGIGAALYASVGEASEMEQATAQLDAVLRSTGGAAGVTKDQALELASAYQETTRYSDDAILSAENMLLTFTNIGSEVFPDATQAVLDMATATGTDAVAASVQLGKALNDPINGISALQRVGVTFTDEQKNVIASMVETGNIAGAQKIILEELNREFGGSAAAAGATFAGTIDRIKNQLNDIKESIGTAVLPIVQELADKFLAWLNSPEVQAAITRIIAWLQVNLPLAIDWLSQKITGIIGFVQQVVSFLQNNQGIVVGVLAALGVAFMAWGVQAAIAGWAAMAPFLPIIAVLAAIAAAVALLYTAWTNNWGGIQEKMQAAWAAVQPAFDAIMRVMEQVGAIIAQVWNETIKPALEAFAEKIATWWNEIAPQIEAVWNTIWGTISSVFNAIVGFIQSNMDTIKGIFENVWGAIQSVIEVIWSIISNVVSAALDVFQGNWSAAWEHVKTMFEEVWTGIKDYFTNIWEALSGIFTLAWSAFGGTISSAWQSIKDWFVQAWEDIVSWFQSLPQTMVDIASSIINGLLQGLKDAWDAVVSWLAGVLEDLIDEVLGWLGISSPSKVFADIGRNISLGLALGIQSTPVPMPQPGQGTRMQTTNIYKNLTIYTGAQAESVPADFAILDSLAGA